MARARSAGRESGLKRSIMRWFAQRYPAAVVRKRHGSVYTIAGDPDLYVLYHGRHIELELKRKGEEPTILQAARLQAWAKAGALVAVVHSVAEVEELWAIWTATGRIADDAAHPAYPAQAGGSGNFTRELSRDGLTRTSRDAGA